MIVLVIINIFISIIAILFIGKCISTFLLTRHIFDEEINPEIEKIQKRLDNCEKRIEFLVDKLLNEPIKLELPGSEPIKDPIKFRKIK